MKTSSDTVGTYPGAIKDQKMREGIRRLERKRKWCIFFDWLSFTIAIIILVKVISQWPTA